MRIQHANNIIEVRQTYTSNYDTFSLFMSSDNHYDSKKCDRKLLKKNLDTALERGSLILFNGDWFDVMGCAKDPRSKPQDIRPEYYVEGKGYLDAVIEDSYEFLKPYANNIIMMGYGNHETSIMKHHDTDVIKRLVTLLNQHTKEPIFTGAYQGAVKMIFEGKTKRGDTKGTNSSIIYYHHGFGGNAPRSKGILSADILLAQNPFADIIIKGHDHQKLYLPFTVRTMDRNFTKWRKKRVYVLSLGSYKKKANDFGWEVEKNFNEPTLGGWSVEYSIYGDLKTRQRKLRTEIKEVF